MNSIIVGLSGLKSAMDTVKGLKAAITEAEVAKARTEITHHLIAANAAMLDVQRTLLENTDVIRALEAEIVKLKDWKAEAARYELAELGQGTVAYTVKPEYAGTEIPHWLCPSCFTDGKKSFLQPRWIVANEVETFRCHACGLMLVTDGFADTTAIVAAG